MYNIDPLKPTNVHFTSAHSHDLSWRLSDWCDPVTVKRDLERLQCTMEAPNLPVTASILIKRLMPYFTWIISVGMNTRLIPSSHQQTLTFVSRWDGDQWLPTIHMNDRWTACTEGSCKATELVSTIVFPYVALLSEAAKVSHRILLENCFIYLRQLFTIDGPTKLVSTVNWPEEWKGICAMQEFAPFREIERVDCANGAYCTSRITCCMKCKLPSNTKCTTCPLWQK